MSAPLHQSSFWFDDSKLFISKVTWDDLVAAHSVVGFAGVVAHAGEVITRGGAFVIDAGDDGIFKRIDRKPELDELAVSIDTHRGEKGLKRL